MRLTTALRRLYGHQVDLEELLYNARLGHDSESGPLRPRC